MWSFHAGDAQQSKRIVPDGCLDLIVEHGPQSDLGIRIVGPSTSFVDVRLQPGIHMTGVRFRPGCGSLVLGIHAHSLKDQRIDGLTFFGASHPIFSWLGKMSDYEATPISTVSKIMRKYIEYRSPLRNQLIENAVRAIHRGVPLSNLPRHLATSERNLRRLFTNSVGISPKLYQRIVRAQQAKAALHVGKHLSSIAFQFGFADQAHLTREFSSLLGVTPGSLQAASCLAELFKTLNLPCGTQPP
jgi:AraC-like DNA-binding protein